jgi:hypothetical protein
MTGTLTVAERERVVAILALAEGGSNGPDGERLAALAAAERLLARYNLRLRDLPCLALPATPPPPEQDVPPLPGWRLVILKCMRQRHVLSGRQEEFLTSLRKFSRISPRQTAVLRDIARQCGVPEVTE